MQQQAGTGASSLPIVVRLKPGTSAEKALKVILPAGLANQTIDQVIRHVMGLGEENGLKRDDLRIKGRIQDEMGNRPGYSINGKAVLGNEQLAPYLQEGATARDQTRYLEAEIVVAARQEGAYR